MKHIIRVLASVCALLKLDLAWNVVSRLNAHDRAFLTLRLLQAQGDPLVSFRRNDTLWTGFTWDPGMTLGLFVGDGHQHRELEALLAWMDSRGRFTSERNVIVDVGANIGISSIPFAQQTNCRIIAIEPVPETFALLQQNVRQNRLEDRITCVQVAVSDTRGHVEMALPAGSSASPEVKQPDSEPSFAGRDQLKGIVEVQADLLSDIVARCGVSPQQVAFVWCDVQGHEAYVMRSGEPLWLAGVPFYIEVEPPLQRKQKGLGLLQELSAKFFDVFIESGDLVKQQNDAPTQPISKLPVLLNRLSHNNGMTDILLLPRGSKWDEVRRGVQ